jgi:1,4-alpha-glucan branching enzyme
MTPLTDPREIERIARGEHHDPFAVLGAHPVRANGKQLWAVRAFLPGAEEASVVHDGGAVEMQRLHPEGFFEAQVPPRTANYRLEVRQTEGEELVEDPYRFPSTLSDFDLHLLAEGTDLQLFDKLGAHLLELEGVRGVRFAVWAPNARRVSVVGAFNQWDGRRHPMRLHPGSGIWEIFIPELEAGAYYKYEILPVEGGPFVKSDPVGFGTELRPGTASVVEDRRGFDWGDEEWMEDRAGNDPFTAPLSIYELHLGSWMRDADGEMLDYRGLADRLADYVSGMGFTHVELLPVMEHPYDPSWGYQVTGYFAPTRRFGSPDDFRYLVDTLHRRGIGVILDWVPAHFPKDAAGLRRFDGTPLYEHADPRQGEHPDWGTMVFNFGRNEVRNFLISNALFWLQEYHLDGLRVDAVASMLYLDYSREEGEWVPNALGGRENLEAIHFLRQLNQAVRERVPGALMIAEESTAWPGVTRSVESGGLGFHFKWNMGWMNDFLRFIAEDPVHRKYHFNMITFSLMYAFSENFVLPISHDEVVHGKGALLNKMPGDAWQKHANLRLSLAYMWTHPGKKLLFMGSEIGQWQEWSEERSLDWHLLQHAPHTGLQRWVRDLNALYRAEPALWQRDHTAEGFEWLDFHDVQNSIISYVRRGESPADELVVVLNFTPVTRETYRVGMPGPGRWRELLNSDAEAYGGSNAGNLGAVESESVEAHGRVCSVCLRLPPLGAVVLKRVHS